jgi:hypothetical protein
MRALLRWPALISGGGLIAGYAVAALTARWLGGLVLLIAGLVAGMLWLRRAGLRIAAALGLLYLALFVASHLLARLIGAWPAVLLVAAIMAGASWRLVDRRTAAG